MRFASLVFVQVRLPPRRQRQAASEPRFPGRMIVLDCDRERPGRRAALGDAVPTAPTHRARLQCSPPESLQDCEAQWLRSLQAPYVRSDRRERLAALDAHERSAPTERCKQLVQVLRSVDFADREVAFEWPGYAGTAGTRQSTYRRHAYFGSLP